MNFLVKRFDELTVPELYALLQLRTDVFVVEQSCPYREVDGLDRDAIHVLGMEGEELVSYLRVLDRGVESDDVSIGRVVTRRRREGLGTALLKKGIETAEQRLGADRIYLEVQAYAVPFYAAQGFKPVSEPFLLDGIPHVKMLRMRPPEGEWAAERQGQ